MKKINDYILESKVYALPSVLELGDGVFEGTIWGSCFTYDGKEYKSEIGALNIFPSKATLEIRNGKIVSLK